MTVEENCQAEIFTRICRIKQIRVLKSAGRNYAGGQTGIGQAYKNGRDVDKDNAEDALQKLKQANALFFQIEQQVPIVLFTFNSRLVFAY